MMAKFLSIASIFIVVLSCGGCKHQPGGNRKTEAANNLLPSTERFSELKSVSSVKLTGRDFNIELLEGMHESQPAYSMQLAGDDVILVFSGNAPGPSSVVDNGLTYGEHSIVVTEKRNQFVINGKLQSLEPHVVYGFSKGEIAFKSTGSTMLITRRTKATTATPSKPDQTPGKSPK
jgi:hypothetical protein